MSPAASEQLTAYLGAARNALGTLPTQDTIVMERFFDESGGMQLVIHSPFGSRLNRAWGLALRKRFCRKFNFELQAAAAEDAIVLSLGSSHSFPIEEVYQYLNPKTVRHVLIQALLAAPMFEVRWRWTANISLAILRRRGGKKHPAPLQRMEAEDLVAAVFPDQIACAENLAGEREVPDHPLVNQTIHDCLTDAMDIDMLEKLLDDILSGRKELVAKDLTEPSPLAQEILSARPYAFLDDAPLEERRTQAVMGRRWIDPESADELGKLDAEAIERVRDEVWPRVDNADELQDALTQFSYLKPAEAGEWQPYFDELVKQRRAASLRVAEEAPEVWVAADRLPQWRLAFPNAKWTEGVVAPEGSATSESSDKALIEILRGRLEGIGPTTAAELAADLGAPQSQIDAGLYGLEAEGFILRGRFTPDVDQTEWCVRRLLARIHRYTLKRLRAEIEPVSTVDFMRFLLEWQSLSADEGLEGPESLAGILDQLEGIEAPAAAWEGEILPSRMAKYDPSWLDTLCLSGRIVWKRLSPPRGKASSIIRTSPISLLSRKNIAFWDAAGAAFGKQTEEPEFSTDAAKVLEVLQYEGALFFHDIVDATGLLGAKVEQALGELVATGKVTADSYQGLRAIVTPSNLRPARSGYGRRSGGRAIFGIEDAGRWSLIRPSLRAEQVSRDEVIETTARILLNRYGVVFRKLLAREVRLPPWRDLVRALRRLEARGEIRGGRFVSAHGGEQFALPRAIEQMRRVRKTPQTGKLVSMSAADPLNMLGILDHGGRPAAYPSNRVLYRDGEPIAVWEAGEMRLLKELEPGTEWEVKKALIQRKAPGRLRAYLGKKA